MARKSKKFKRRWFVGFRQRPQPEQRAIQGFICERCGCSSLVVYSSSLVNDAVLCAKCFYSSCDRAEFVVW